jgi:hypothetical protein
MSGWLTEDDLAAAYRENAEHASETNEAWGEVSDEATQHLEPVPVTDDDSSRRYRSG